MTLLERLHAETEKYSEVVLVRMSDKKEVLRALAIAQAVDELFTTDVKKLSTEEVLGLLRKLLQVRERADEILEGLK
jgi:hypothetical protein